MSFERDGISDFLTSGAVPLNPLPVGGQFTDWVYALWDNEALMLALWSDDRNFCAFERTEPNQMRQDDSVEVTLTKPGEPSYRALFHLTGLTAFDRLNGDPWYPQNIQHRFKLQGEQPPL